ncbi:MAG TPA: hypothetical protein VK425_12800 [Acidimicrobiales bacterium]|nr:hypothetical protein [Acidimicrobiales bacterium]
MGAEEEISLALRPVVEAAGLEIWDIERSGTSVRVSVEGPGGVDLDTIARVSGAISAVLDTRDDLVPVGHYVLEVSSPGLERRLRYPRHFARHVGQVLAVKTVPGSGLPRRLRGTLVAVSDDQVVLLAEPRDEAVTGDALEGGQEVHIALSSVERANTVFSWGSPVPKRNRPKRKVGPRTRTATATAGGPPEAP